MSPAIVFAWCEGSGAEAGVTCSAVVSSSALWVMVLYVCEMAPEPVRLVELHFLRQFVFVVTAVGGFNVYVGAEMRGLLARRMYVFYGMLWCSSRLPSLVFGFV